MFEESEDFVEITLVGSPLGPNSGVTAYRREPVSTPAEKRFYRVPETVPLTGLSKGKVFQALGGGRFAAVELDGCLLIPAEYLQARSGPRSRT